MFGEPAPLPALNLDSANRIIVQALQKAREMGVAPLAVVVLDAAGHLVAAQREDGASMFRFDVALGKAWGAVAMGCSSRDLAARAVDNPNFFGALAATAHGRFLPQPGAVLIQRRDGQVLGAIGASGGTGDEDEMCCAFAVSASGRRVDGAAGPSTADESDDEEPKTGRASARSRMSSGGCVNPNGNAKRVTDARNVEGT